MLVADHIAQLPDDRKALIKAIHEIILSCDKSVVASVEPMMGMTMIIYKATGFFKYGLASGKIHMSLHVLPIYGSKELHQRYETLLKDASFQKGCINFKTEKEMPVAVVKKLIKDCAPIDLLKIREEQLKKKAKSKAVKK
jgi:hypothetical protein